LAYHDREAPRTDDGAPTVIHSNIEAALDGTASARKQEKTSPSHLDSRDFADPSQDLYALDSKI